MRILICDDDLLAASQLKTCLQQFFNKNKLRTPDIAVYPNGETLLADTKTKDIVFLDIVMPVEDGIDATRELRAIDPSAVIIIVSSIGTKEELKNAIEAGAKDFVQKPFNTTNIRRIIETRFEH